jgi:hypothetical protein
VKAKMKKGPNGEPGEWRHYDDNALLSAKNTDSNSTQLQRERGRANSMQSQAQSVRDFDVTWIHLNTIRHEGQDYVFFTLGPDKLLSEPTPIGEIYGTDRRPYAVGFTNLEAHRTYPASKLELLRDLQTIANDAQNMRFDAMKLALNPRVQVKAGAGVTEADIRTFRPGKPIMLNNPGQDMIWDRPPDPTQAAYAEQDRINVDFDELAGSFGQSSVLANRQLNETVGGMEMLSGAAGTITEYELKLFATTWAQPVIEQLIDLEERLEEDGVVLALAGQKAGTIQHYGTDEWTNWLLSQRMTVKVNVGTGATNPMLKFQHLETAAGVLAKIWGPALPMGLDFDEICTEIFGLAGFSGGKRFFKPGFDPMQAMMQMEQMKAGSKGQGQQGPQADPSRLQAEQIKAAAQVQTAQIDADSDRAVAAANLERERMTQAAELQRAEMRERGQAVGHMIRTLPPVFKDLLVAHHDRTQNDQQHRERLMMLGRRMGAAGA